MREVLYGKKGRDNVNGAGRSPFRLERVISKQTEVYRGFKQQVHYGSRILGDRNPPDCPAPPMYQNALFPKCREHYALNSGRPLEETSKGG